MNRGRIQSQDGGLNDSKPWAQPAPLLCSVAISMSHALEAMPNNTEKLLRAAAHISSRNFMCAAHANGGVVASVSKTYMVKGDPHRRVDVEVHAGLAFT